MTLACSAIFFYFYLITTCVSRFTYVLDDELNWCVVWRCII